MNKIKESSSLYHQFYDKIFTKENINNKKVSHKESDHVFIKDLNEY